MYRIGFDGRKTRQIIHTNFTQSLRLQRYVQSAEEHKIQKMTHSFKVGIIFCYFALSLISALQDLRKN